MVIIPVNYPNKWSFVIIILIIGLLFSHLEIVENGFFLPQNYLFPFSAFAINAFYTASALFIFQLLIDYLDFKIPWTKGITFRFLLQIVISLIGYIFLQSLIIYTIEPIFNQNESTSIRIVFTYIIGVVFVVLLNLIYLIFHFQQKEKLDQKIIDSSDFLYGILKGKKVSILKSSFLFFFIESGIIFGVTQGHQKILLKDSLSDLEKLLNPQFFFRVNRKQIISKDSIRKVVYSPGGNGEIMLDFVKEEVMISRRKVAAFRKWLKKK